MNFLDNTPPFMFFTGKGGVGKTSIACATAIHLAAQGKRTLLVSTDPASNVGQVFEQAIGPTIVEILSIANLSAIELDPQAAAEAYRRRIVDPVRGILPDEVIAGIEEQLSGACTTEIAAFDEFTGLLTNQELLNSFDHIVFDTAPTGHTIRMLQLPGAWSDFIAKNPEGSSCLGPLAGLEKQKEQYQNAVNVLADKDRTRLVLVARAQKSALTEVGRTFNELAALGIKNQYLVINGVLNHKDIQGDALAHAIYQREQGAMTHIPTQLSQLPVDQLSLKPFNLVGIAALKNLFQENSLAESASMTPISLPELNNLGQLLDQLADQKQGLIMLMGKGGVGKTTLAAAIAVNLAQRGMDVHLSTSDPAAHLHHTLDQQLPNLSVSRINPQEETERYRQQVLATAGKHMSAEDRMVLEEDLRSPCTEEIAVFQAFSKIISEAGQKIVVMDTAPTGHTLLLLDATGAYHREVTRKVAEDSPVHVTTPMMHLQNPDYTKVIITTLAETTPVLEAAHLQDDLRRAGIEPWAWVINNSVAVAKTASPLLNLRAKREIPQIDLVKNKHARNVAIIPLQAEEPVGVGALAKLSVPD